MNIDSTEDLSDRTVIITFKATITTRQRQTFNHITHKEWSIVLSRQQEENNKNEFNI